MKKIEFLFPELSNIFGEFYNIEYLKRCNKDIKIIETNHKEEPKFLTEDIDMVYLGTLSEAKQEQVIEFLKPYKNKIEQLIKKGTIFLITGNSIEIFGKEIKDEDKTIKGLGIFNFTSVRNMNDRHNSQYVGLFKDKKDEIIMLGHRSQFSFSYGDFKDNFIDIDIGIGMNPDTKKEGIHKNNFFATYSLGPYLIMNPLFTKYILRLLNLDDKLLFEDEIIEAYEYRKNELIKNLK